MAHEAEKSFVEKATAYLEEIYGEENVETNKYLNSIDRYEETTVRYCDIYVKGPLTDFAIEAESNFDSVWKGKTQAEIYSKLLGDCVPVIIIQKRHVEEPEASMIREDVQLMELDL